MGSWLSTKGPGEIWIGVAGPSGAGKTSLIQALLGDTNGGAPPDPNTGSKVVQYTHPRHPNVTFWEIPSEAVSRLESDPYDLIIIASPSENFGSEFAKFAVGGQAKGKACYFVRMKIDAYIQQYGSSISSVRELDQLLEDITSSCSNWLAEMGVQSSPIFLVSNARTDIYQLPQFCNTIEETIDELNRSRGQSSSSDPAEAPGWNLAILGDHWSGKSSLINALRGVRDGDTGAAQTGMEDSVTEPVMYPFPKYPKIRMWELPAISASTVPHQYLKQVSRDKYGTFIIIASEIFKEHHCRFAKALADMGKEVLFVRTKIDGDLQAFKQRHKPEYNERRSVEEIRQICVGCLEKGGVQDPDLFILTSFQTEKFGFRSLVSRFENHPDVIK
uniref:interferon-gamma-inducible GTPase 10-like n=1 Tax=Pristiophorus japonicus TaxID=55135 RepID=UPI00398E7A63